MTQTSENSSVNDVAEVDWFWSASGKPLGYRVGDAFFGCDGKQIGQFEADEIYSCQGAYLGEVSASGRLITKISKSNWNRPGFPPAESHSLNLPPHESSESAGPGFRDFRLPNR